MFASLLLGVGLLLLLGLVVRAFVGAEPRRLLGLGKGLLIAAAVALVAFLAATGRISVVIALAVMLAPAILRLWRQLQWAKLAAGGAGAANRTSTLETKTLRMTLDHGSGDLDGEVKLGPAAGRRLADLDRAALADLLRQCAATDRASLPLLEAFLDRRHPDWRQTMGTAGADAAGGVDGEGDAAAEDGGGAADDLAGGAMSREQAYRILGLAAGASDDEVQAAHHRLIALVHPDRGGSGVLAAQVNRARDILLGRRRG